MCLSAVLQIKSTNTYLCNSSLFNKVLLVITRALILPLVVILLVRTMITIKSILSAVLHINWLVVVATLLCSIGTVGDGSCTASQSCDGLNGTYNDNNTGVYCLLYYMSTNTYLCNSSLFNKVMLVKTRALVVVPVIILMVRTMSILSWSYCTTYWLGIDALLL